MRCLVLFVALCAVAVSARTLADTDAASVLAADSRIAAVLTDTTALGANSMAHTRQRQMARQQIQPEKGKDGGATTLIANKNYMSLMEDEDGNPLPPDANQDTSGSSSLAPSESSKPAPSASGSIASPGAPSSSSATSSSAASGSASASASATPSASFRSTTASASAPSEGTTASESVTRSETATAAVTESAVTEAAAPAQTETTTAPRFRSLDRRYRTQAEEQRAVEAASQQNAIAEVAEAMEGAQKVNERNSQKSSR